MILLNNNYDKVIEQLRYVTINHLFVRSVIEQQIGVVYVDNIIKPSTFYVEHPYGMSLLFGNAENADFNAQCIDFILNKVKEQHKSEWLQVFPDIWNTKFITLIGESIERSLDNTRTIDNCVEVNTRVNFKFNKARFLEWRKNICSNDYAILRTDLATVKQMQGTVIPLYFWRSTDEFIQKGIGFSLKLNNTIVSTAFSAFIVDDKLEIGIETVAGYQGKGFAVQVCIALIDYCLVNNYEPVWSCRLENTGSYFLAQKLGFEPTFKIPFYKIKG